MKLNRKQRSVLKGMVGGFSLSIIVLYSAISGFAFNYPKIESDLNQLSFVIIWFFPIILWLAISIGRIARFRFFSTEDIDGAGLTTGSDRVKCLQAILQNTLEQSLLAIVIYLIWSQIMPIEWIFCVPAASGLFFIGRLLFVIGYEKGAGTRAMGFALTFYPTMILLVFMLGYLISAYLYLGIPYL